MLVAAGATLVLVIGGLVALSNRGPDTVGSGDGLGETLSSGAVQTTDDPLNVLDDLPPDQFPPDVALRFSAPLGESGQIWVYDSASTSQVCFVRHLDDTTSVGCLDQLTYGTGQGWSSESNHGASLLWGFTATTNPVTVTIGDIVVSSDENGLWFTVPPPGATAFTISTASGTETYELAAVPAIVVTAAPAPDSTTAVRASDEFCTAATSAAEGLIDFNDPEQTDVLVNDPSVNETDRLQIAAELQRAAAGVASGAWSNDELVFIVNRLCGTNLPAVTMAP
jgi:hypothetical protein